MLWNMNLCVCLGGRGWGVAGLCVVVGVCLGVDSSEGYSGRIAIATPGRAAHTLIHPSFTIISLWCRVPKAPMCGCVVVGVCVGVYVGVCVCGGG